MFFLVIIGNLVSGMFSKPFIEHLYVNLIIKTWLADQNLTYYLVLAHILILVRPLQNKMFHLVCPLWDIASFKNVNPTVTLSMYSHLDRMVVSEPLGPGFWSGCTELLRHSWRNNSQGSWRWSGLGSVRLKYNFFLDYMFKIWDIVRRPQPTTTVTSYYNYHELLLTWPTTTTTFYYHDILIPWLTTTKTYFYQNLLLPQPTTTRIFFYHDLLLPWPITTTTYYYHGLQLPQPTTTIP